MNMFKPVGANNVEEYIALLNNERRKQIEELDSIIRTTAPNLKRYFAYNMIGYGKFKYTDYKKREIDWPIIALASQKNYISIYVSAVDEGEYLAEKYKKELGKVNVGKSCIRLKRLEDLNMAKLKDLIITASKAKY